MNNWFLNCSIVFEIGLAAFLMYTPGVYYSVKMRGLKLIWWLLHIPFSTLLFVADELRKYIMRSLPHDNWIEREFYT